jgi:hypothetical protein
MEMKHMHMTGNQTAMLGKMFHPKAKRGARTKMTQHKSIRRVKK